jgi:hypothetical protein
MLLFILYKELFFQSFVFSKIYNIHHYMALLQVALVSVPPHNLFVRHVVLPIVEN